MNLEALRGEFSAAGAWLEGHFVLSSGLHSSIYLQCARALMEPDRAARLCGALAGRVQEALAGAGDEVSLCVSPAMGGVIAGYEAARQLGVPSVFAERVEGVFRFRRGFEIPPGAACVVVEDVVTTGGSVRECIAAVREAGGRVVLAAALVDRSGGRADVGVQLVALLEIDAPHYAADDIPPELRAIPPVSPGSRRLPG